MGSASFYQYAESSGRYGSGSATWTTGPTVTITVESDTGWRIRGTNSGPYSTSARITKNGSGTYTFNAEGDGDELAFQVYCPVEESYTGGDIFTIDYNSSGDEGGGGGSSSPTQYNVWLSDADLTWDYFPSNSPLIKKPGVVLNLPQPYRNPARTSVSQFVISGYSDNNVVTSITGSKDKITSYTFDGWMDMYTDVIFYTTYNVDADAGLNALQSSKTSTGYSNNNLGLLSKPSKNSVSSNIKITYNSNGGSNLSKTSDNIIRQTNYDFSHWCSDPSGNGIAYNDASTFTTDTNVYAIWNETSTGSPSSLTLPTATKSDTITEACYTVTYNGNGGTPSKTSDTVSKTTKYKLSSWNTSSNGSGITYSNTINTNNIETDTTLYAIYSPESEIVSSVTLPTATRDGYAFKGWSTSQSSSQTVPNTYTPSSSVTLYAVWEAANTPYIVNHYTKDLNASTYSLNKTETKYGASDSSVTLSSLSISIANHTYKEGKVNNSIVTSTTVSADGSRVIDLYYTRNMYSVTLLKDSYISSVGFSGLSGTTQSFEYGSIVTLTVTAATGCAFVNWTGDYTSTTRQYSFTMPTNNVTLTANGRYCTYTIKFNGNGSTSGSTSSMSMTYGTAKNLTTNGFKRTGYRFNGWNTSTNGSGTSYTDGQSVNNLSSTDGATVNLYAQWIANTYTIKFNGNGSTSGSMSNMSMTYGTAKKLTANKFEKTDYNFVSWNTKSDGSGTSYTDGQSVNNLTSTNGGSVTLYAQWERGTVKYQVIYNVKKIDNISYEVYDNKDKYEIPDSTITISNIADILDGFTYDYATVDNETVTTTTILADGSRVINLYYNRNKYDVSINFDNDAISGVTGTGSYYYGESVTVTANTKGGYTWDKWTGTYTSTDKSFTFNVGAENISLTPNYIPNNYTITFDGNGSESGSTQNMSGTYSSGAVLNANEYVLTGYDFVGWNTKPDGTGILYKNGEDIGAVATDLNTVVTLYAIWRSSGLVYIYNEETFEYEGYQMYVSNGDNTWDLYTPYISNGNNEYELY